MDDNGNDKNINSREYSKPILNDENVDIFEKLTLVPKQVLKLNEHNIIDSDMLNVLSSVGFGSTDGRHMTIRKLPKSPSEFFRFIDSHSPPNEYTYTPGSFSIFSEDSYYFNIKRYQWSNKIQFVMACVSYSIGFGNVWRFPYLCYKSEGGGFLIPYFLMLVICGVPMLYMELSIGQYIGRGPIGAIGQMCPLLKGTGLASVLISFLMSTYYSVIIAYGIYYFFNAFRSEMPWTHCSNRWNSPNCWTAINSTKLLNKISTLSSQEFYKKKVLQISEGIHVPGQIRWELLTYLFFAWILIYFSNWRSIKSSGKVRYFTATLAPFLIVIFLIKSLTLDGSMMGLQYFLYPNWEVLTDAKVWVNATAQNFNSFGIAIGSMICFSSYNRYHNNILQDTVAISLINAIACLLVGMLVFSTIGNIATELNASIVDVISDGPGMIFILYPQAIANMPGAQFLSILFFFMLICLGLNTQFAIIEVVVTSLQDAFPRWIRRNLVYREILVLIICVISFLVGIPNVTQGGIYFFQLIDHYTAQVALMYVAFFEVIAVTWFYGVSRLSKNITNMNGKEPLWYLKICWAFATPITLMSVWIFYLVDYESPTYDNEHYHYPLWAIIFGWSITSCLILCIPLSAFYVILKCPGNNIFEKLKNSIHPDIFECEICGVNYCEHFCNDDTNNIAKRFFVKIDQHNKSIKN